MDSILIVDDNEGLLDLLHTLLKKEYRIRTAKNPDQARRILETDPPGLILLDVVLPEENGFDFCRFLKQDSLYREIPVLFLTARGDPEDVLESFQSGGSDYIQKPCNPLELKARIKTHLEISRNRREMASIIKDQNELLHILCHDVSVPLTSIMGLLEEADGRTDMEVLLGDFRTSAVNGLALIRQICSLHKALHKPIELETVDLNEAILEALVLTRSNFRNKEITVVREIEERFTVQAERVSLINSVLINLFSNAAKFSPRGSDVQIRSEHGEDRVRLIIRDNGTGMTEEVRRNCFSITRQIVREGTDGESGIGSGMPLVQRYMNLYGGGIEVNTIPAGSGSPDHGTEIILTFRV